MIDLDVRPFNARSLVLSVLLGLDPPALASRALIALAEQFDIAPGTMRTALSRMVAAGDLVASNGGYELVGRLLERKEAQDVGRRPVRSQWDGSWWMVVVTARRRTVAERRAFRSRMANARMGELRPDAWLRPANLGGPLDVEGLAVVRGQLSGDDPADLTSRLWPLDEFAAGATTLLRRLDALLPAVQGGRADALPEAITLAAAVVRFLRAEPLLPPSLIPQPWPPDALRARYGPLDRAMGRILADTVRAR